MRRQIRVLFAACAATALALLAVVAASLLNADYFVRRVQGESGRVEALEALDAAVGRYGWQIADQLLTPGNPRSGDLQAARNDMDRVLENLARASRLEIDTVGAQDLQSELPEIENVRRMTDLYHAIDASLVRALSLLRQDDRPGALDLYGKGIEFRLTNELRPLIDDALARERSEMGAQIDQLAARRTQLLAGAGGLAALLLILLAVLAGRTLRGERAGAEAVEARAAARIAELDDRLRQSASQLRSIEADRARFLGDVGHQLRTPLTVLRGEVDVALRGNGDAAALRATLQRLREHSVELGLLLDDLIDTARQDADAAPLQLVRTRIADVVALAIEEGGVLAEPRELRLVADIAEGELDVAADFRRLRQVLMIAVDNAVKHSPPGSAIDVTATRSGTGEVVVRIGDRGPGLAEADQPHVFERFFRGQLEKDLLNPGFGIGLSIAKDIVARHGGSVSLANREGGGAVFEMRLPPYRQ